MSLSSYFRNPVFVRNFVFGIEDSIVSTTGLISGIAAAQVSVNTVVLVGTVLIFVEAFSMAMGSIISEHTVAEMSSPQDVPFRKTFSAGIVMFLSYLISGFVVLLPYFIFSQFVAFIASVLIAFGFLILLGMLGNRIAGNQSVSRIAKTVLIGGLAIVLGIIVGLFFKI